MAAITMISPDIKDGVQFCETLAITNQTANSTAVTKGLFVPPWATKGIFTIFFDSSAGTSPLFDFVLGTPDWGSRTLMAAPTDATDVATLGNAAWNGITQVTGNGPYQIIVEVGPDVTDDDTGSATASCYYGVKCELPPVITYTYTTDGTTDDEDYGARIAVNWKV
jgi:hypothetical protein